jgi:hypothetical protein
MRPESHFSIENSPVGISLSAPGPPRGISDGPGLRERRKRGHFHGPRNHIVPQQINIRVAIGYRAG